jgi:transposase
MLKNRIHATMAKYAIEIDEVSDLFGAKGREILAKHLEELPSYTRQSVKTQLELLNEVENHIQSCEEEIRTVVQTTPTMELLKTIPGVGSILAVVIALEIGDIDGFPGPDHLASYAGTVPRVKSSGGKTVFGRVRPDVNRYLRWALIEAANVIMMNQARWPNRHVVRLYLKIRERRGHAKAIVAVGRHLAEAAYWVLKKNGPYREPISSTQK